jgi:hypothetical protein
MLEAKVLIERWRQTYNTVRPHSSLGYRAPALEVTSPVRSLRLDLRELTGWQVGNANPNLEIGFIPGSRSLVRAFLTNAGDHLV